MLVAPVVAVVVVPAVVEVVIPDDVPAWDEAWDDSALAADVLNAAELEVVVVLLELGTLVELLTRVKRGVKLYASGPTLETLEAGPMIIWMA